MRLYAGTSSQFIGDTIQSQIVDKLRVAYQTYYQKSPSRTEITSWKASLLALCKAFQYSDMVDHGVVLEYGLPLSSQRLDCMISGRNERGTDEAIIIELKQWSRCELAQGENEVLTFVGGAKREHLHPSVQVGQYKSYLKDLHSAFHDEPNYVRLNACAYLFNYRSHSNDPLLSEKFKEAITENPLFLLADLEELKLYLSERLKAGDGARVLERIEKSKHRASRKLLDHVGAIIKGNSEFTLLDQQLVVYDKVISCTKRALDDKQKNVIIVAGGPGTGKSLIALNLVADLSLAGYNSHYVTGSMAFTQTLRKIVGTRAGVQFKYTHEYVNAETNEIDVLICDEAHRLRPTSFTRFIPRENRTETPQIQELVNAAKVSVFFVDDKQVVRPNEIGSVDYINKNARKMNCRISNYELPTFFRCNGSDGFVNWIEGVLGLRDTANIYWNAKDPFDFRIFDTPDELETEIRDRIAEGNTARITAGFCWPWSDPNTDGSLEKDVVIGNYKRAWNAKPNAGRLAPGVPKAFLWAHDPRGVNQIGCIYTAQGFEFDYVGVIMGNDLSFDQQTMNWRANKANSFDPIVKRSKREFLHLAKNTYRVLFTRGLKGCYVYFVDENTERLFRSRICTEERRVNASTQKNDRIATSAAT